MIVEIFIIKNKVDFYCIQILSIKQKKIQCNSSPKVRKWKEKKFLLVKKSEKKKKKKNYYRNVIYESDNITDLK